MDYIFNYYKKGIDVVFDGSLHEVKMIILHLNPIPHAEFGRYSKCFFSISEEESSPTIRPLSSNYDGKRMGGVIQAHERVKRDAEEDMDSCGSQWMSAGSSPCLGPNFGSELEERHQSLNENVSRKENTTVSSAKKKTRKKEKRKKGSEQLEPPFETKSSSSVSSGSAGPPLTCESTIEEFKTKLGESGDPAVIYWNLDESEKPSKLDQTMLYSFPGIKVECTTCGRLAAVYLYK